MEHALLIIDHMSTRRPRHERTIPLSSLPSCAGGLSRRDFCALAGTGLLTLGLSACASNDPGTDSDLAGSNSGDAGVDSASSSSCTGGTINAGPAASIAQGTAKHLSGAGYSLFICRDAGGLYALDASCTHEGQLLTKQSTKFYCSRHGATFDLNGQNPTSPAFSPLDHYSVCVDASGTVMIDSNTVVAPATRV